MIRYESSYSQQFNPSFGACWPARGLVVGAPSLVKPLYPYQAYRRAGHQGAWKLRFGEHMPHPTKAVDGNHDIFPILVPTGGFGGEGEGRGGEGRREGMAEMPESIRAVDVQCGTKQDTPHPSSSDADEVDEAQYRDRDTLPRSVSPAWVGHAGERRRSPAGHLYGTGESTDDPYCSNQPVVGCTRTPIGQGQAQLRNDLIMKLRPCPLESTRLAGRGSKKALGGGEQRRPVWQLQRCKWPAAALAEPPLEQPIAIVYGVRT